MTDQIVITEKSSQAKDVRAAVGGRYGAVLPAEGHLLDLCEPEDVNPAWKRWSAVLLRPDELYGTKPASGGNKAAKLKAIRAALRTATRVWLATDCDREGQLIGQEILEHCGYRGEVLRVLFTAQDAQTIREGRNGSFHDKGLEGASHHAVIPNVNTIGDLGEIWPRLSGDEKKLFDAVARSYLASVMPDYRYRQTTVTLDARGFEFRAAGRQPIEAGWRDAFPDWRPAEEKGEAAQVLPAFRDKEAARLRGPEIEDKETRPPPRYKEGTLIEAMQNAWRFVADETLRDRLKEAKGIGTPATRAEIIGGLKKQGFLTAQGQNIVPTDRGLALFGVLERADPALVDPGVTAELECLLDDVVTGKQEMMGAIDAVCDAARRIIGSLGDGAVAGEAIELEMALSRENGGEQPPTAAMKKFAASIARHKGIKPPAGYTKSGAICRAFLDLHAPERTAQDADRKPTGETGPRPPSPAQVSFAEAIAREKDVAIPDEARVCTAEMSAWIDANRQPKPAKGRKASAAGKRASTAKGKKAGTKTPRTGKSSSAAERVAQPGDARTGPQTGTPLRIPYGNKEVALQLGARYAAGGWYAPPGVDLVAFREREWL